MDILGNRETIPKITGTLTAEDLKFAIELDLMGVTAVDVQYSTERTKDTIIERVTWDITFPVALNPINSQEHDK